MTEREEYPALHSEGEQPAPMVTWRAVGRDFEGPADTLEALKQAKAFAEGYLCGKAQPGRAVVSLVTPGCLPLTTEICFYNGSNTWRWEQYEPDTLQERVEQQIERFNDPTQWGLSND